MWITPLLGRLMLRQKFFILSAVTLVLTCIPAYLYSVEAGRSLNAYALEKRGIRPLSDVLRALQLTQQHRALAAIQLGSVDPSRVPTKLKMQEIGQAYDAATAAVKQIPDRVIIAQWNSAREDWEALKAQVSENGLSAVQSERAHTALNAKLLAEIELIADHFGLSLDPDRDTYQLIQFMYYQLPYLTEDTGRMRVEGLNLLAHGSVQLEERLQMSTFITRVRDRFDLTSRALDKAINANSAIALLLANEMQVMTTETNNILELATAGFLKTQRSQMTTGEYMTSLTKAIDSQFMVEAHASEILDKLITEKISHFETERVFLLVSMTALLALAVAIQVAIARSVSRPAGRAVAVAGALSALTVAKLETVEAIASGNLDREFKLTEVPEVDPAWITSNEMGTLMNAIVRMSETQRSLDRAFHKMLSTLRQNRDADFARDWVKTGVNDLNAEMRGDLEIEAVASKVLNYLCKRIGVGVGVLYFYDSEMGDLRRAADFALSDRAQSVERIALGEGLSGQAGLEKKMLTLGDIPEGYLPIGSGLGRASPRSIVAIPLVYADNLNGVLELGLFRSLTALETDFLEQVKEDIAIAFGVNLARRRLQDLLMRTEEQAEELRAQQDELQQTNAELEERADLLERQRAEIDLKSDEVELANMEIRHKIRELESVSAYKSEFLVNMSHELRTPLNSLLILSGLLKQNKEGNLSAKQVEYAATVHAAGTDLLNLINDILDLSKVESGKMDFFFEEARLRDVCAAMDGMFRPVADQRGLSFNVAISTSAPTLVHIDILRTQQILKNLLSNALKFTHNGEVSLRVWLADNHENVLPMPAIALSVTDTGIGIAEDKKDKVFEEFKQADGSISRKYGGTGLGLSISRRLAHKMGGELTMRSSEGVGSTFTLFLPLQAPMTTTQVEKSEVGAPVVHQPQPSRRSTLASRVDLSSPPRLPDDRDFLSDGAKVILIVEDDLAFAGILMNFVREHGFAALLAMDGESGVAMAGYYRPHAVLLDVMLPTIDGWEVLRRLKGNTDTSRIPVHFVTCVEDRKKALDMGAIGFITKPATAAQLHAMLKSISEKLAKPITKLLIVEENVAERRKLSALLSQSEMDVSLVGNAQEAVVLLATGHYDCMVLNMNLAEMADQDLAEQLQGFGDIDQLPVIVHAEDNLAPSQLQTLQRFAARLVVKAAGSSERLLEEVLTFLHSVERSVAPSRARTPVSEPTELLLKGLQILLVDDDMRNIFSLSALLSEHGAIVVEAENGLDGLRKLTMNPSIDVVLMDIMMPQMDGYIAMREIRANPVWRNLPVIAMTAKAMPDDYQKCIEAGASDYIAKPIDTQKLVSLLRVWGHRT